MIRQRACTGGRVRFGAIAFIAALSAACGGGDVEPVQPAPSLPDPATTPALKSVFADYFLAGAAIEPSQLNVPGDAALLQKHFSSITAENVMKPATIGTGPGTYNFGPADQLIQFARNNSIQVRHLDLRGSGFMLVEENRMPG